MILLTKAPYWIRVINLTHYTIAAILALLVPRVCPSFIHHYSFIILFNTCAYIIVFYDSYDARKSELYSHINYDTLMKYLSSNYTWLAMHPDVLAPKEFVLVFFLPFYFFLFYPFGLSKVCSEKRRPLTLALTIGW
jgi:hypothetical protein